MSNYQTHRSNDRYQPNGYRNWKQTGNRSMGTTAAPMEKQLTASDFPALPTSSVAIPKTITKPEASFVDRVKEMITKEDQRKYLEEKKRDEEKADIIPLSSWMHKRNLVKKQERMDAQRMAEEEDQEYRYQISHDIPTEEED